jgi:hypothetical protein
MTAAKFKPCISCVGLRLVQYSGHFRFHDFARLLLAASMILLCNRERTEFGKPHAYRGPMCPQENCQWCEEPSLADAAISLDEFMPHFPRRDKRKSLQI